MTSVSGGKLMTLEQFKALPEDDRCRQSLVAGWVLSEPWPPPRHGRVQTKVSRFLDEYVEEHGLGEVYVDCGFILSRSPDTLRVPDVAFVRQKRVEAQNDREPYEGAPDLAVEVLSPSERARAIHAKVADYLAAGGRAVWLVDPERRQVTVFRSPLTPKILGEADRLDGEDVVPGFSVSVAEFFR
jgi:Uma2 family endonuclease